MRKQWEKSQWSLYPRTEPKNQRANKLQRWIFCKEHRSTNNTWSYAHARASMHAFIRFDRINLDKRKPEHSFLANNWSVKTVWPPTDTQALQELQFMPSTLCHANYKHAFLQPAQKSNGIRHTDIHWTQRYLLGSKEIVFIVLNVSKTSLTAWNSITKINHHPSRINIRKIQSMRGSKPERPASWVPGKSPPKSSSYSENPTITIVAPAKLHSWTCLSEERKRLTSSRWLEAMELELGERKP